MSDKLKAFQIRVDGKILDYLVGKQLNLDYIKSFFKKRYFVKKLWSGGRHILGILEKNNKNLFLKLATTEGISELTKIEYNWNEQFNNLMPRKSSGFWVPQNEDFGIYNGNLFYLITDRFEGRLLAQRPEKTNSTDFIDQIPAIINFSELIQKLNIVELTSKENPDYRERFFEKTKSWYNDIPKDIIEKYQVVDLLKVVEHGISKLKMKPRHGDFTPWHLFKLTSGQLGLIDGEHAKKNGVEYYDIGYFIQRVFSVLENPNFAEKILSELIKKNYSLEKLIIILAARAIGGFLDESLKPSPDYTFCVKFKDWVINNNSSKEFIV